jgi:plastocyanin
VVRMRRAVACAIVASMTVLAAGCAGAAQPSPSSSAAALELVVATDGAAELRFVPAAVSAPANTAIRLTLRNVSTQAHNLTFADPKLGATRTIVEAGGSDAFDLVTPDPGRYPFACTIHMEMSGTLTVE